MDPDRERIQDDLRGLVDGRVRCDHVYTQLFASDASIFEIEPIAVVQPRHTRDVAAAVQYARENELAIHPRGAGTGTAGGCLGRGIVLDFSHSMRRVLRRDDDSITVQPGVVLSRLNQHLEPQGRIFGPNPSTGDVSTIGGVLATNRSGSRWLRYGSPRDQIISLEVVLGTGEVFFISSDSVEPRPFHNEPNPVATPNGATNNGPIPHTQLTDQLGVLVDRHRGSIEREQVTSLVNECGYAIDQLRQKNGTLDLTRLIAGSEGTLAIITEATLRTVPAPQHTAVGMLFFERVEKAARAVGEIPAKEIVSCDLMDRRLLSLAREADVRYDVLIPRDTEAILLVEVEGDNVLDLRNQLKSIGRTICRRKKLGTDMRIAVDAIDVALFRQLVERVLPTLSRLTASQRPIPFIDDIAVDPKKLPEFLTAAQNVLKRQEVTASLFAHAGHGQVQLRPFLNLADPENIDRMQRVATELYQEVLQADGTISSQQGDGLSRSWFVRRQYPELYPVFREIKRLFDPDNVLNPSKVTEPEPLQLTKSLRPVTKPVGIPETDAGDDSVPPDNVESVQLLLNWSVDEVAMTARACNGCGSCRSTGSEVRMCPIFRFSPSEEASPRAKANIMRGLFTGQLVPDQLADDDIKSIADLCVNCHQCRQECPAGVDIPKLMIEYKAQHVATNGLPFHDWLLCRTDVLANWASKIRLLSNFTIGNRRLRWVLERLTGLAQGRKLPRIAKRSFLSVARRQRLTTPTRGGKNKVVYFTDVYANWFDVQLAESVVNVFQHNGISVYVPPGQIQAGMSLVAVGAIEKAKEIAARNIELLVDAIRQGYTIVTAEPSAALCLTREYANMFADEDVQLIADNTFDACHYLWKLHQQGQLELDLKPLHMTVGYHTPCHTKAMGIGTPAEHLLKLIPGISVKTLEKGCSGMAGTYGLKKENYRNSLRAGWPLISAIRAPELQIGATECSTCKMQMEQGTDKPTIHPIKLLALSYGLTPEVAQLLSERRNHRFVT